MLTYIKGFDKVMANLNAELDRVTKGAMSGLIEAVNELERDMDTTPPLVPIDSGNLRSSFYRDPRYTDNYAYIIFGFNAAYAWWVHEMVGANFKRPGAGAKFMEAAIKRNSTRMLEIIRAHASIGGKQ